MTTPARVKNQAIVDLLASPKPATADFNSDVGDFQDSTVGFIQATYSSLTVFSGCFELFVSIICDPTTLVLLPNSKQCADAKCPAVGYHLTQIGFRFFQLRYTANGETTGTIDRIVAVGKKGG